MMWFTSDTHLGHAAIIKHSNRPFANADEMDHTIIANINSLVGTNDVLYHLGDWCWGTNIRAYRRRIRCENVVLILGNHDREIRRRPDRYADCFNEVTDFREIKLPDGNSLTLCHYALKVWNKSHHGTWHLYGHSHGSLPDDPKSRSFDIGVDCHAYKPLNLHQVGDIMAKKDFTPIDHHGARPHETRKVTRY
jgi:calcineurin-like phosphoesterase family protein